MSPTNAHARAWIWLSLLATVTAWAGTVGWYVLTEGFGRVSMASLIFGVPVLMAGAALRWRGVPALAVAAAQAIALGWIWFAQTTGSLVPDATARALATAAWADGLETARRYAAPIGADQPPVTPLLLAGALAVMWLVENLVGRFRAAAAAGVVLLVAYVVPASITSGAVPWWSFVLTASLYVATLYVQHTLQIGEWGRVRGEGAGRYGANHEATTRVAAAIGAVAVGAALLVPSALPSPELSFFSGPGTGAGKVSVHNPVADLRRDLVRPDDVPLMDIRGSDGVAPTYLRLSVLTRFAEGAWRPGDRSIPPEQAATGAMPPLDGVADAVPRAETDYQVSITDLFSSRWLPVADQTSSISAGSGWLYDVSTRDVLSADEDETTATLNYSYTGVRLDLDPEKLNATTSARNMVRPIFLEVPSSVPNSVRELANEVTADMPTRFQKAQRLQQWFRQDGGFIYDLRAADQSGHESDLVTFLDEEHGRVGYCEQFAASMAIMARTLDIPARVAIGFLEPERTGPRSWRYSAWDMHAWPELYFPDAGWVRFEPTPSARAESVPDYTTATLTAAPTTVPAPTSAGPTEDLPDRNPGNDPAADTDSSSDEEGVWAAWLRWIAAGAAGVLVLVAVALLPRGWRAGQRRRRHAGDAEAAWSELRAHALDLGLKWPEGRSPAYVAGVLESHLAQPVARARRRERPQRGRAHAPEAAAALDRLRQAVEVQRYAATQQDTPHSKDLDVVTAALSAGVTPRAERRARWWPRSVFRRERTAQRGPVRVSASAERSH